jgi:hypothetical protein
LTGLYDIHGVLRYSGRDPADCLAYAEFFGLIPGTFTLSSLEVHAPNLGSVSTGMAPSAESLPPVPKPPIIPPPDGLMAA